MVADKRDKPAALEGALQERCPLFFNKLQFLMLRVADGKNHSAAPSKLGKKWRGNRRCGRGNEDAIEWRKFWQTHRAIATVHVNVSITKPREAFRCGPRKLVPAFNGKDLFGQTGENRGLVAAAGPYF